MLLVTLDHLVLHGEVIVRINSAFLWQKITHVAVGGQYFVILTQVLFDGLAFGGRLYDDKIFTHEYRIVWW